ncbi:hypothetical protein U1Q18_026076 [Sarracenia purpurea var. burkii]
MATVPTLQFSNQILFTSPQKHHAQLHASSPSFTTRATNSDDATNAEPSAPPEPDSFDARLSQVRIRYRSGTGKKAEVRKVRKGKKPLSAGIYLPPVPLKESLSGDLKVDFGFSPYSERINGRVAILGLSALALVELATGKGVLNYHSPAIVFVQVYFVAAVSAVYVKYEKEKVSVWPQPAAPPPPSATQE